MIQVTDTRYTYAREYPSNGGVGGFTYQPETTTVEWSDGTRLVVEDLEARAMYRGRTYPLPQLNTSLHEDIVEHWTRAISIRLQRDVPASNRLANRVRNWKTEYPEQPT